MVITDVANYYKPLYFALPKAAKWHVRTVAVLDIRRAPSNGRRVLLWQPDGVHR